MPTDRTLCTTAEHHWHPEFRSDCLQSTTKRGRGRKPLSLSRLLASRGPPTFLLPPSLKSFCTHSQITKHTSRSKRWEIGRRRCPDPAVYKVDPNRDLMKDTVDPLRGGASALRTLNPISFRLGWPAGRSRSLKYHQDIIQTVWHDYDDLKPYFKPAGSGVYWLLYFRNLCSTPLVSPTLSIYA